MLLRFGCLLGYKEPDAFILSDNLPSALIDPSVIYDKLAHDLSIGSVVEVNNPAPPFISSPLGLVPKHDRGFRKVHHLSYPGGDFVNDYVADEASSLSYTPLHDILAKVLAAGRQFVMTKRDGAFRSIPVAMVIRVCHN